LSSQSAPTLQALVPLHVPSSVPMGTSEQVPTVPATLHARHVVVHVALQQTPSTQNVDTHSVPPPHVLPSDFLHVPLPSHASLPLTLHAELMAVGGFDGLPCALHKSCVHGLPSTGLSLVSTEVTVFPAPSHSRTLQLPAVCPWDKSVPAAVYEKPH